MPQPREKHELLLQQTFLKLIQEVGPIQRVSCLKDLVLQISKRPTRSRIAEDAENV